MVNFMEEKEAQKDSKWDIEFVVSLFWHIFYLLSFISS